MKSKLSKTRLVKVVGPDARKGLIVLGMHRSGTSALTRVLSLLGAALPRNLMPPVKDNNEAGFWEPQLLANLHDKMLEEMGSSWDDWRSIDFSSLSADRLEYFKTEIKRLVADEYGDAPLFVVKDPRICRFVPLYECVLAEMGVEPLFVHSFRNPLSVIASLARRDGMTEGFASLVWLRHVLEAEYATRGKARTFLAYETLLDDWKPSVEWLGRELHLSWPRELPDAAPELEGHLKRELQHHAASPADLKRHPDIAGWVKNAYAALAALAKDQADAAALTSLDRVKAEFDAASTVFAPAFFPELAARQKRISENLTRNFSELDEKRSVEIEHLKAVAEEKDRRTEELSRQLGKEQARATAAEEAMAGVTVERNALRLELEALGAHLAEAARERVQNAALLAAEAAEKRVLSERVTHLEADLAGAQREAFEAKQQRIPLMRELELLQKRLDATAAELDQYKRANLDQSKLISALESEKSATENTAQSARTELERIHEVVRSLQQEVEQRSAELHHLNAQLSAALAERDLARSEEIRLQGVVREIYGSTSWRIGAPIRFVKRTALAVIRLPRNSGRAVSHAAYATWRRLPLPMGAKQRLKNVAFTNLSFLFARTDAYRAWQAFNQPVPLPGPVVSIPAGGAAVEVSSPPLPNEMRFVPRTEAAPLSNKLARVIAFYLPQFHPIPENDEWWGKGFTEWTNVRPAQPQFVGHHQPHVPVDIGYYDLRDAAVQRKQIELAKLYGVEGFCFYFYWFAGKRLLETPIENWLNDSSLDLPFCLCWANENWSRRWDGLDAEILIAQDHSPADDLAFIREVARYMRDPRYIRIDGKPVLLVYRPSLLPSARETAARWREWCRENGIGEIYLAYTQSFEKADPQSYGFDAAIEFPPNNSAPPNVTGSVVPLREDFSSTVYDWSVFPARSESYPPREYKLFRSVCPGWDNTARRKNRGTVFINNTPELYKRWLENAINDTLDHITEPDERLIFVNAWNEWAEGAHLEPDAANGYAYLQATRNALENTFRARKPRILVVSHDAHPHGAQYLALNMVRGFVGLGFEVDVILLGEGPLLARFASIATVHRIDLAAEPEGVVLQRLKQLRGKGAEVAIANTTVSGLLVPLLKEAGFRTVSLIHELPGVLKSYGLEKHAAAIADGADRVLFPAQMVRKGFEEFVGRPVEQALIRPQGVLRKNPFKGRAEEARRIVCEKHGLAAHTRFVLNVAFVDHRKGPDLFIEIAEKVLKDRPDLAFIWIGHFDAGMEKTVSEILEQKNLADRVKFVGFVDEPMAYYAGASAYALTSREDPFPNVVLESAEVGVPVVAFERATGAADFILEQGGRLAAHLDVADFAARLIEVIDGPRAPTRAPVGSLRQYLMDILHHAAGFQRVSAIVPNYNYAQHLPRRLGSIAEQTHPIYELIVLDDASSDDSVKVIGDFLARHPELDATLVVNEENSGSVFRQWEKGVALARGDLVWIAEADDLAESDFLKELAPAFADPSLAISYSQSRQIDGEDNILAADYLDYTSDISGDWRADYVKDGRDEIARAMAVKNTIPNVSAVVFRREAVGEAIAELGDELFGYRIAGDWLIYLRILLKGRIRFVAKSLNSHRRHGQSVTRSGAARKHLREVERAQEAARGLVPVPEETQRKAGDWLEHVRRYLGADREADAA